MVLKYMSFSLFMTVVCKLSAVDSGSSGWGLVRTPLQTNTPYAWKLTWTIDLMFKEQLHLTLSATSDGWFLKKKIFKTSDICENLPTHQEIFATHLERKVALGEGWPSPPPRLLMQSRIQYCHYTDMEQTINIYTRDELLSSYSTIVTPSHRRKKNIGEETNLYHPRLKIDQPFLRLLALTFYYLIHLQTFTKQYLQQPVWTIF